MEPMRARDHIRRSTVAVDNSDSITHAADIMEEAGVGALVVLDNGALAGIVTDRDLVVRALAKSLPPDSRVDAVMSCPVVTIDGDSDIADAYRLFKEHALRRLPVTDSGRVLGMVTVDDLLVELTRRLSELTRPVFAEVTHPQHDSPVPATPDS